MAGRSRASLIAAFADRRPEQRNYLKMEQAQAPFSGYLSRLEKLGEQANLPAGLVEVARGYFGKGSWIGLYISVDS